jgi:hypothetical protein
MARWSRHALEREYLVEERVVDYDGNGDGTTEEVPVNDLAGALAAEIEWR